MRKFLRIALISTLCSFTYQASIKNTEQDVKVQTETTTGLSPRLVMRILLLILTEIIRQNNDIPNDLYVKLQGKYEQVIQQNEKLEQKIDQLQKQLGRNEEKLIPNDVYPKLYENAIQKIDHLNEELGINKIKLSAAELAAATLEFLFLYRNKLVMLEDHYCFEMPTVDDDFLSKFRETKGFEEFPDIRIKGKQHFRKWLWILTFGDEIILNQLSSLRKLLNYSPERYVWYAEKMQSMFELLSDDNHSIGQMLNVKFVKKDKIKEYLSFLNPDLQEAGTIFFTSEGWIKN